MNNKKNIVYLYSEVMPYTIAVMRALVQDHGATIDCVHWDKQKRTPFVPQNEMGITFFNRSSFDYDTLKKFIEQRNPAIIYVVGRMDDLYLKIAWRFHHVACMVTGSDNQWSGNFRQRVAALLSWFLYRRYFGYFWVPGTRQYSYAIKMGYAATHIIPHLLTADITIFGGVYEKNKQSRMLSYPHTLVFAGRFTRSKGVDLLIEAFRQARSELNNDWRLILIGEGDVQVNNTDYITVKGFTSSAELAEASVNWGVFCLPSLYEPWGVVVHEFTMAGLPMICSSAVGAADDFVKDGENGFIFSSGNTQALKKALATMMAKSDDELCAMSARSYELSKQQSPSIAARSLMNILEQKLAH